MKPNGGFPPLYVIDSTCEEPKVRAMAKAESNDRTISIADIMKARKDKKRLKEVTEFGNPINLKYLVSDTYEQFQ